MSVLGPTGDYCTPPANKPHVDYVFMGLQRLEERCKEFFDEMQVKIQSHVEWGLKDVQLTEERLMSARDRLEQYVMYRIAEGSFRSVENKEEDAKLLHRMKVLSFLTYDALDIPQDLMDDTLLTIAMNELRNIIDCRTPMEKVACVEKSVSLVFRLLNLSRLKRDIVITQQSASEPSSQHHSNSPAGADDFLPLFIWVVLRAQVPQLYSNCEFIHAYLSPARLMGKAGYCLINLESAIAFLTHITPEYVSMDAKEFDRKWQEAEDALVP